MPKKSKKKKNQKKKKKSRQQSIESIHDLSQEVSTPTTTTSMAVEKTVAPPASTKQDVKKLLMQCSNPPEEKQKDSRNDIHVFWDNELVPRMDDDEVKEEDIGPIEPKEIAAKRASGFPKEGYTLAKGFEWYTLDLTKDEDLNAFHKHLTEQYVEDARGAFRLDYSREFLRWVLLVPGYVRNWHVAIRVKGRKTLVACITASPAKIRVYDNVVELAEINFLCVHKKLRDKRLAPVLVKEISRRVALEEIYHATYTAVLKMPRPISKLQFFHRFLDPKKLVECGFAFVPRNSTISRMNRLARVAPETTIEGLRPMIPADVPVVTQILNQYLSSNVKFAPVYDEEDVAHWFLPRDNCLRCFVKETDGNVTDMFSYYILSQKVINNTKHDSVKGAYSFYNVPQTEELKTLISNALTVARIEDKMDVFNCMNIMERSTFFKELKFTGGNGWLHLYMYNYLCPELDCSEVGLILM